MKYKNREVEGFSIGVELGKEKIGHELIDFKNNEKFVAESLKKHNIHGWSYIEAPINDFVEITPKNDDLESVNNLFNKIKEIFKNVSIQVLYVDFNEDGNLEEINEPLKIELFTT